MNGQPEFQWKSGDTEAVTVIGMSYQHQLDTAKGLVFQTHIPSNADPTHINAMLDKLVNAGERQRARVRIPELETTIKTKEDFLARAQGEMFRLDAEMNLTQQAAQAQWTRAGKKGELRLGVKDENDIAKAKRDREQAEVNLKITMDQLTDHRNELVNLRALLEG